MKFMIKPMICIAIGCIVFDWAFYSKKDFRTPYHFNCKMAYDKKMSGNPCARCEKKYAVQKINNYNKLRVKYETKFNKSISQFTDYEIMLML
jgi:hypothetical protein